MAFRGTVKGKIVELEPGAALPEGAEVEVTVKNGSQLEQRKGRGSPDALLKFLATAPRCTAADVDALLQAIESGKQPVRFSGIFDKS
jgi:hypothetical protein